MPTDNALRPGFIALHGNRAEDLAHTTLAWLRAHPLGPLEEETIVVQSNGMAEWLKMAIASQMQVCAATRVELPARFLWRTYRQVLGAHAVPRTSPLDKLPMTWRLMQVLPTLLHTPDFAPVQRYLRADDGQRLLQLASQLADLFDQYQNYRSDWLQDWADGHDNLRQADGQNPPLGDDQRWQAQLWRAVLTTLTAAQRSTTRPQLHLQALARLQDPQADLAGRVTRRVVVFGMSHMPLSTLEALVALGRHSQVVLAVPNPCRFYWGDIIEGRELLRAPRRRQPLRGAELSAVALEDMHQHAHPLLAAWGRQGRDFIRQLDAYDDSQASQHQFQMGRIDLFDEATEDAATPLLLRVQQRIRDLEPLQASTDTLPLLAGDASIVFHIAHSRVRELEVLHDQLLQWLAAPADPLRGPLQPRDIVVMVPDIESMAPAIAAVFGQYPRHDPRHIPFDIADLSARASSPIVVTLEWLLRLPAQRCQLSELVDLLEVPAIAARFGISAEQLPQLTRWMSGAGIRWGLNATQREHLGLAACGPQNTAWFGLQRMLLGFASGSMHSVADAPGWAGIEPYTEIGGLDAELAGSLAHLLQALLDWWQCAHQHANPEQWAERSRTLLQALFAPTDEQDSKVLSALNEALVAWLDACNQAGFDSAVPLHALRHGWLEALNEPSLEQRFQAGGITFCTLMPMRAVPFEMVCLLGMNDGDYPRRSTRSDFDLMGLRGQHRPGDRSRQQDDRQLMLEALLSARRSLYISWSGFSVRDNSEQPPSVLVAQLRDYLAAVWGRSGVEERTTAHPLQPFSRRYFAADSGLHSYAYEWRSLHTGNDDNATPATATSASSPLAGPDLSIALTLQRLAQFYRNPARAFFRERLGVVFEDSDDEAPDIETFAVAGLEHYQLIQSQTRHWPAAPASSDQALPISQNLERLQRAGELPLHAFGTLTQHSLHATLQAMAAAWQSLGRAFPTAVTRIPVEYRAHGVVLRDWLDQLYAAPASADSPSSTAWLELQPSRLLDKKNNLRPEKMLSAWLRSLLAALGQTAPGVALHGRIVAQDCTVHIRPLQAGDVTPLPLDLLLGHWLGGMQAPLPLPLKTALTLAAAGKNAAEVYEGSTFQPQWAEVADLCWARCFADFEALEAVPTASGDESLLHALAASLYGPLLQWLASHVTCIPHHTAPSS